MFDNNLSPHIGYSAHANIDNLSSHTDLINEWDFEYHQVSAGKFTGHLNRFWLDGIGIYEEHLSQCIFQQGEANPNTLCIGVFRQIKQPALWMGKAVDENDILCIYPNTEVMIKSPQNSIFYALHFPMQLFFEDQHATPHLHVHHLKNNTLNLQLYHKILYMISFIRDNTRAAWTDVARSYLKSDIIELGDQYLKSMRAHRPQPPISKSKANQVVKYLINYLIEHKDQPISMEKCCQLTQMSRRTLQNYFEAVTGQSPSLFLKYWRLNGVRRMLQQAEQITSIGDVASNWGFWHLSQFATDYKRLFGEQPSTTRLQRFMQKPSF